MGAPPPSDRVKNTNTARLSRANRRRPPLRGLKWRVGQTALHSGTQGWTLVLVLGWTEGVGAVIEVVEEWLLVLVGDA